MSIKLEKDAQPKGVLIPSAALKLCGLQDMEKFEIHIIGKSMTLLPGTMTAPELLHTISALQELEQELCDHLVSVCGECNNCNGDFCPFSLDQPEIKLSPEMMEAAGIPQDARLVACPDKETATINITRAPFDADLREIPRELLEKLSADGICMGELAEKFAEGAVVYGG